MARLASVPLAAPRVAMYGRVSAVMGRGDDLTSPELQEHVVRAYCQRRGYQPVVWLCDVDRTGRSWSRRQVEQAVRMVEARDVDLIVVPRWSRFTRNLRDYVIQVARVEAAGGRVESALEETDPATAAGLLQRDLFAILAQWESRKIGEQWKETHQRRWRAGLPHVMQPRLGYQIVDRRYVADPREAPIVVELYARYLGGAGTRPLARWLAGQGIRSKTDPTVPWSHHGIIHSLDSGFAAGLLHVGGQHLPGDHPPIVDVATWEAYRVARRTRVHRPPRYVTATTALSGLLRCSTCGQTLIIKSGDVAGRHEPRYYYACQSSQHCTWRASVTRAAAEEFVKDWLRALMSDAARRSAREVVRAANATIREVDRTVLLDKLADVEHGIDTIEEMYLLRQYKADRRARLLERLDGQKDELLRQLEKTTAQPVPRLPEPEHVEQMLMAWERLPAGELNDWLRTLITHVRVERTPERRAPPKLQVIAAWEI